MARAAWFVFLLVTLLGISGCDNGQQDIGSDTVIVPVPQRQPRKVGCGLVKMAAPALMPNFIIGNSDIDGLSEAVANSLNYLSKPSSQQYYPVCGISHEDMVATLQAFSYLLQENLTAAQLNQAMRQRFDIYTSSGANNSRSVLFTGYYVPVFDGSRVKTAKFSHPLYKLPVNLVRDNSGKVLGKRTAGGALVKYPSSSELEKSGELAGSELVWLKSSSDVYVVQLQGSARIKLQGGGQMVVGFAGSNGYDFVTGVGKAGNSRFVFFKEVTGVRGSIDQPLVPLRSVACNDEIFPRGGLAFMTGRIPVNHSGKIVKSAYSGFVLNQDTGSAFKDASKCDIYMGEGAQAGRLAMNVYDQGRLYFLVIKEEF